MCNKLTAVIKNKLFLLKMLCKFLISSVKVSGETQTSCVRLVKVYIGCKMIGWVVCWYVLVFCTLSSVVCCCSLQKVEPLLTINDGPSPLNRHPLNKPPSSLTIVTNACRMFLWKKILSSRAVLNADCGMRADHCFLILETMAVFTLGDGQIVWMDKLSDDLFI